MDAGSLTRGLDLSPMRGPSGGIDLAAGQSEAQSGSLGAGGGGPAPVTGQLVALDGVNDSISTPDSAAVDVTGDIDVRCAVAMADWTPAGETYLISKWLDTGDQRAYVLALTPSGNLGLTTWSDGSVATQQAPVSTAAPTVTDGDLLLVRATLDVDNGASGNDTTFYTKTSAAALAVSDLRDDSGWTQLGAVVTNSGTRSIHNSTTPLVVGALQTGAGFSNGDYYGVVIKDGIGAAGTEAAVFDPNDAAVGATSVTDSDTGLVWALNGGAVVA